MNSKKLCKVGLGFVLNFLLVNEVQAMTVAFSRQYDHGILEGVFTGKDKDQNAIIEADEIRDFQGTFRKDNILIANITSSEAKSIKVFNYVVGQTESLHFGIETKDRKIPGFPNDINVLFQVDFKKEYNLLRNEDVMMIISDANKTGTTSILANEKTLITSNTQVPEPTSLFALLMIGGWGTSHLLLKKNS
ncbi:hypothetical protein [Crocosphaera chwakensis]|uniref:PEP-CTERM protein-sorting domain-containing protein n=1 Tax=Crocosphaera chwakensis CCY0110 TaxID=391612 RepID=A3IMG3_9CHRO|nr:hypothetical protein [Crocosphaera chwakensis]EAZ92332.1 hypothetical protein CY0110_28274 [Crocosphaera chwakensis CCY0110]